MVVSSALPPGWSVPPREEWLPCRGEPLLVAGEGNSHDVVPLVWLVAAHGGAGVSTLCQWWDFVGDAGRMWPDKDTYPAACLVAKATMESLGACDKQVRSVVAGATACLFLGVVIVDPLPKLPRRVQHRVSSLVATVEYAGGRVWRIPYCAGLVEVVIADLPTWSLSSCPPAGKLRRWRGDVTCDIPDVVARVGFEIAQEAMKRLRSTAVLS